VVTGVWKDGRVGTYRGIRKGALKYSANVFRHEGRLDLWHLRPRRPGEGGGADERQVHGLRATAIEIAKFFKTGKPPVSAEETTELFAFMEAAEESKRQDDAPVKLETVLAKARKK